MEDLSVTRNTVVPMTSRRRFSDAEKLSIIEEAEEPGATVSGVAKKHGIKPNLLFGWRKKFASRLEHCVTNDGVEPTSGLVEHRSMLAAIQEQESLLALVTKRLSQEVRSGKGALYNTSCAISNLASATVKFQERRSYLIERLAMLEAAKSEREEVEIDLVTERMAEEMYLELVKARLEEKRQAAAQMEQQLKTSGL